MRAPGLLPLLPLLLLGVSSQNDTVPESTVKTTTASATTTITMTTDTSKMTETSTINSPQDKPLFKSPATGPATTPKTTPEITPPSVNSSTPDQGPTPTNRTGPVPTIGAPSATPGQGHTTTDKVGNPSPAPTTSLPTPQQVSSAANTGASTAAATPTTPQNQANPTALGSSGTTTNASSVFANGSSIAAPSGGLGAATTSTHRSEPQGCQPLDHGCITSVSTEVPRSSPTTGAKDLGVPSSSPATTQPHSCSCPGQNLTSSPSHESTHTTVSTLNVTLSLSTHKTSLTLPPGNNHKTSEATTLLTPVTGSHDVEPTSAKPTSASQGPASAQPPPPAPGDKKVPYSPSHQHLNTSFHNEVICKDENGAPVEVQNNWVIMSLKENKTCDEWRTASANISFFESLCSTGWHAFNASRDTCTVTLMPHKPHIWQWAMQVVLHLPLQSEHILEEPERKAKLEELGIVIANITSDKADKDMLINDEFSTPLIITIVTLAGSLLLIAAIYGCCHQRFSQKKDQHIHPDLPGFDDGHVALIFNRLTEELQTMENGYHDNPTLEVMETSSEMQEKKVNLNGELGDSWIVPLDTLMKEDLEEEEDTHL